MPVLAAPPRKFRQAHPMAAFDQHLRSLAHSDTLARTSGMLAKTPGTASSESDVPHRALAPISRRHEPPLIIPHSTTLVPSNKPSTLRLWPRRPIVGEKPQRFERDRAQRSAALLVEPVYQHMAGLAHRHEIVVVLGAETVISVVEEVDVLRGATSVAWALVGGVVRKFACFPSIRGDVAVIRRGHGPSGCGRSRSGGCHSMSRSADRK